MATSTKVNGSMIKLTGKASTCITMEPYMRALGRMTNSTVMALKLGLMRLDTKVRMLTVPNMVMVNSIGTMEQVTQANSATMISRGMESTLGAI